jgi:hypothetical protein
MEIHEYQMKESFRKYGVPVPRGSVASTEHGAPSANLALSKINSVSDLTGKRVGLYWNTKPNGDVFLSRLAELIEEKFKIIIVKFFPGKVDTSQAISDTVLKKIGQSCDLVILATGD